VGTNSTGVQEMAKDKNLKDISTEILLKLIDIDISPQFTAREEALEYLKNLKEEIDVRIDRLKT
jgi:hypothetical protein